MTNNLLNPITTLAGQVRMKTSALSPLLWFSCVFGIILAYACLSTTGNLQIFFAVLLTIVILALLGSYFYLLHKNPDYLRSESYQLKVETLKYLGDKDNNLNATAGHMIELVHNPELPAPESLALPEGNTQIL